MKNVSAEKGTRGGAVKRAPEGYYTAQQAQRVLGIAASKFHYLVKQGKIKKTVPPMRSEGFYSQREINELAIQLNLLMQIALDQAASTETRIAKISDTPDIVEVLTSRGWKTATAQQRASWYTINPFID